uniref:Uncharacterized protein n=1 Tax=Leersia perrieri TaxID=77586 RepID=A0A0D9VUZ0_9ORYZ
MDQQETVGIFLGWCVHDGKGVRPTMRWWCRRLIDFNAAPDAEGAGGSGSVVLDILVREVDAAMASLRLALTSEDLRIAAMAQAYQAMSLLLKMMEPTTHDIASTVRRGTRWGEGRDGARVLCENIGFMVDQSENMVKTPGPN